LAEASVPIDILHSDRGPVLPAGRRTILHLGGTGIGAPRQPTIPVARVREAMLSGTTGPG